MKKGSSGRASAVIAATPEDIYDTIADVTRVGEFSPECRAGRWLNGATAAAPGARFKGTNRRGLMTWSTRPVVLTAERGREFSFVTSHRGKEMTRWCYRLRPADDATEVTESFELLADLPRYLAFTDRVLLRIPDRRSDLQQGMERTLTRLSAALGSARTPR